MAEAGIKLQLVRQPFRPFISISREREGARTDNAANSIRGISSYQTRLESLDNSRSIR